jgi:hypothetical protein
MVGQNVIETKNTRELLGQFCAILRELRRRGVTRSTNNPVGDIAETLVVRTLKLELVRGSTAGFDAKDASGNRYEIKGRRITAENKSRQMSFIRNLDKNHFEFLVGVLFDQNFEIARGCIVPLKTVKSIAKHVSHVNGWRIELQDSVWNLAGVLDITAELKKTFLRI